MKLNLGCGNQVVEGWVNVDYALGARFAKIPFFKIINKKLKIFNVDWDEKIYIHDLNKTFPWQNDSVDVIYSSHTLEHLTREKGRIFINECFRVLKKNGVIRIIVPDLRYIIQQYLDKQIIAEQFLEKLYVVQAQKNNKVKNYISRFWGAPHKCMYDSESLLQILNAAGFSTTCKLPFESKIEDIYSIELEGNTQGAVLVEGIKL